MAAISYAILIIPEKLWEPLGEEEKQHLADWLYQINEYTQAENNWQYFKVMVNLALKSVGMKWNPAQVKNAMDQYESFYLGNGWYSDGKRPQKDYYISFGIHFYCLLYAKFMGEEDPQTAETFKKRAVKFAETFLYWFDDEGKALPFGRSLTYRFAQAAFFSACALADVECFSWGVMRGILERHLEYWMRQPIFDNGGVLTVGYTYPNLLMSEAYNAPGSPYWALKTFLFLALPDEHPFWKAESLPLPELKKTLAVKECDMLLCHRKHEVVALTAGQYPTMEHPYMAEKYAKFAYSSMFGFCVSRSYHHLEQAGTDSMLTFYVHGMYYVRRKCLEYRIEENLVYAKWEPTEEIQVETWIVALEHGHKRKHRIISHLNTVCKAYDCGFSYPNCMEETEQWTGTVGVSRTASQEVHGPADMSASENAHGPVDMSVNKNAHGPENMSVNENAHGPVDMSVNENAHGPVNTSISKMLHEVENNEESRLLQTARVSDIYGKSQISSPSGSGIVITAFPNMNLVFPNVCIPAIQFDVHPGITEIETIVETAFSE